MNAEMQASGSQLATIVPERPLLLPNMILLPCPDDGEKYKKEQVLKLAVKYNDKSGVVSAIGNSAYGPPGRTMRKWFPNKGAQFGEKHVKMLLKGYTTGSEEWKKWTKTISNSEFGPGINAIYAFSGINAIYALCGYVIEKERTALDDVNTEEQDITSVFRVPLDNSAAAETIPRERVTVSPDSVTEAITNGITLESTMNELMESSPQSVIDSITCIIEHIAQKGLTDELEALGHAINEVAIKREGAGSSVFKLCRKDKAGTSTNTSYKKIKRKRAAWKKDTNKESRDHFARRKANELEESDILRGLDDKQKKKIFEKLAQNNDYVLISINDLAFTPAEIMIIRNHLQTSTRGANRLKQVVEVLRPELKGLLFPPQILQLLHELETSGVVPVSCKKVELQISRDDNKRGICVYSYISSPGWLLERQTKLSVIDGTYQPSSTICNRDDKVIVVFGIDKSDTDLSCSVRLANRLKGNSANYVQAICSAEKCAETYENEKITIFNKNYPTGRYLQGLVHDNYHMMIVTLDGNAQRCSPEAIPSNCTCTRCTPKSIPSKCTCALFLPWPKPGPVNPRHFQVEHISPSINEQEVAFDKQQRNAVGLPPKIAIPLDQNEIRVRLVHSKDDSYLIIGYQIFAGTNASTHRFNDPLSAKGSDVSKAEIIVNQCIGFGSNDGKQVNILTGQCSSSCQCSCPVCMCLISEKGIRPEWWQMYHANKTGVHTVPICKNAQIRDGEFSFDNTYKEYQLETAFGGYGMSKDQKMAANKATGSSFNEQLLDTPNEKHTNGPFHTGAGCTTHSVKAMIDSLKKKEEGMSFWKQVMECKKEVEEQLAEIKSSAEYKRLHKDSQRIGRKRQKLLKQYKEPVEENQSNRNGVDRDALLIKSIETREERLKHAQESKYADLNQMMKGLQQFEKLLTKHTKADSKKPRGQASWALVKSIEYDAGGKFVPQNSGFEQTNKHGMNTMENFSKVSNRVANMYAPNPNTKSPPLLQDIAMDAWLRSEFVKYERLAETLSELMKTLKSQEKQCPNEFKEIVYQFTLAWDDAFPEKHAFNKLHFLISHMPKFVELWEMVGILSEESFEAFHGRLAKVKDLLKSMPCDLSRVETINARMQCLLKKEIMEGTVMLESETTGKKTGPQTNKRRVGSDNIDHIISHSDERTIYGVEYIVLTDGALLKKKWKDFYLWFSSCKAPQSWLDAFHASTPLISLSEADEAKAQFSKF